MEGRRVILVWIALLCCGASAAGSFIPASYPFSALVFPGYKVFWSLNVIGTMRLALQVETEGWIGFGIGEQTTGSMPGSDIVVVTFDSNPAGSVHDLYAMGFYRPAEDSCQDWVLVSSQLEGGTRTVELIRNLVTNDPQDRPFIDGPMKVVAAYGSDAGLQYHGSTRAVFEISFLNVPTENPTDSSIRSVTFYMNNYRVPAAKTTYTCVAHAMPLTPGSPDFHLIEIEPFPDSIHAHHLQIHICDNTTASSYANRYYENPGICNSPTGEPKSGCRGLLPGWARGVGRFVVPEEAGYRIGWNSPAFRFIVVEMHYDNPNLEADIVDNTALKLTYTSKLRKYDAGTLTLGDPLTSFPNIPAGSSYFPYEASCTSACTTQFSHEITVFASEMHMHQIGAKFWTTQYRNGEYLGTRNRADFYEFNSQQHTLVNYTIKPGDLLNVHCIYDSSQRTSPTRFSIESTDEMCMDFLSYYPVLEFQGSTFSFCGYFHGMSVCGSISGLGTGASFVFEENPSFSDLANTSAFNFGEAELVCTPRPFVPQPSPDLQFSNAMALGIGLGLGIPILLIGIFSIGFFYSKRRISKYSFVRLEETSVQN